MFEGQTEEIVQRTIRSARSRRRTVNRYHAANCVVCFIMIICQVSLLASLNKTHKSFKPTLYSVIAVSATIALGIVAAIWTETRCNLCKACPCMTIGIVLISIMSFTVVVIAMLLRFDIQDLNSLERHTPLVFVICLGALLIINSVQYKCGPKGWDTNLTPLLSKDILRVRAAALRYGSGTEEDDDDAFGEPPPSSKKKAKPKKAQAPQGYKARQKQAAEDEDAAWAEAVGDTDEDAAWADAVGGDQPPKRQTRVTVMSSPPAAKKGGGGFFGRKEKPQSVVWSGM